MKTIDEGSMYVACVLDLYSRRIVGWSMGSRMTKELVIEAFKMAMQHRNPSANFGNANLANIAQIISPSLCELC